MEAQYWWFALGAAGTRARVSLDHALRRQVALDAVANSEHIAVILHRDETDASTDKNRQTYSQPVWTFCAKSQTFQSKTDAGLTVVVFIWAFVTLFATNSLAIMR